MISKVILFNLAFLFATSQTVCAHPGGLDENGGHVNKKTGVYHYHSKKKHSEKKKDDKKKPKPSSKKIVPKKTPDKPKLEKPEESSTEVMSEEEPDFSIFDKLTAENEKLAGKKKQSKEPVQKKAVLLKHQVIKTERSNSKAIIYVGLLDTKTVPTDKELLYLSRKLDSGHRYLIYFFLPSMKANRSPWAIALETTSKKLEISRYDKRAPKWFQALLKTEKAKLEKGDE